VKQRLPARILGILTAVMCLLAGATVPSARHAWVLRTLKHELAGLQHPPGTEVIDETSDFGLLSGNGNHCDFVVYQLRLGNQNWEELAANYERAHPRGGELDLEMIRNGSVVRSLVGFTTPGRRPHGIEHVARGYVVSLHDYGNDPEGDVLCY
jgi:hypothetical protein